VPVPGASHWLPDEAPDRVAAAVLDRVAAHPPPGPRSPAAADTFADLDQRANAEP